MTDDDLRSLLIAWARLEAKFDAMKEDLDELKDWKNKILMLIVSTVIVGVMGLLLGTGVVNVK